MIEFRDDKFVLGNMPNRPTEDDIYVLKEYTNCITTDDYKTHYICVIIMHDFVFVAQTYAQDFKAKRKLLKLMKLLYTKLNRRVLVGKDSEMFNRQKISYDNDFDEIIIRSSRWAEAE